MATFTGTFAEFYFWFDAKIQRRVTTWTKKNRDRLRSGTGCQRCSEVGVSLQAHHQPLARRALVQKALEISADDMVLRDVDLSVAFERIKAAHLPIQETLRFVCQPCHSVLHSSVPSTP